MTHPSRRTFLALGAAALFPRAATAYTFREITWEDLIPRGVAYGQIVGPGQMDQAADTWIPHYDENAHKLNMSLVGKPVKLPGYIIPFDLDAGGVKSFMLVPYVGACIHVPPPPPNQLVFVTTRTPWPSDTLWDPVWVSGRLTAEAVATEIADVGYRMAAERIEVYEW